MSKAGTVGIVGSSVLLARAAEVVGAASLHVAWAADSFDSAASLIRRMRTDAVIVEFDDQSPSFWKLVKEVEAGAPRPFLLVVGRASMGEAFKLARAGVDALSEALAAEQLKELGNVSPAEGLVAAARRSLGQLGVKEAQRAVRVEMFREALRRENGNRHAAARILGVDRRYVLKMAKETSSS